MLKYTDSQITFSEIPDEITLCINISNCPFRCKGCHSKELWEDVGKELTPNEIDSLLQDGVSCLLFMGGDSDLPSLTELLKHVKICYPNVKTAWYSGRREVPLYDFPLILLDYIKLGPYIKEKGPLNNPNTNQRLYKLKHLDLYTLFKNITARLWKKNSI